MYIVHYAVVFMPSVFHTYLQYIYIYIYKYTVYIYIQYIHYALCSCVVHFLALYNGGRNHLCCSLDAAIAPAPAVQVSHTYQGLNARLITPIHSQIFHLNVK